MATFNKLKDLCDNRARLSETELVFILKATQIDPKVFLIRRNDHGQTLSALLHLAASGGRSPEFCKVLHSLDATLVKTQDSWGWLPVHHACFWGCVETAKYLFELYPDSVDIATAGRNYPLHLVAMYINENEALELIFFLLRHDNGAVSTPNRYGELPLHLACRKAKFAIMKLLFDAHPDGIFVKDDEGHTLVDIARSDDQVDVVHFLQTQLEFNRQAQEDLQPDSNGQLPIHRAMHSEEVSLGAIKLMVSARPTSVAISDNQGCIPLHIACQFGHLNIVKYLVEQNEISLTTVDSIGNLPLHCACLGGKPDIVNFILKTTDHGVSVENDDGKLPIQIILYDAACARDLQHMDAVDSLLRANPIDSLAIVSPGFFVDEEYVIHLD